jgi:hypothetical protein
MAQPTRCDGQADRRRLSHDDLREKTMAKKAKGGKKKAAKKR